MSEPRIKEVEATEGVHRFAFSAMASDCECQIAGADKALASSIAESVAAEAWRIERRFSRYRADSALSRINRDAGQSHMLDEETARLVGFADSGWRLSNGLFDITSGVLRKHWDFGREFEFPQAAEIKETLKLVGWGKVSWQAPVLTLPEGMALDLGGLAKEYAVDRCCRLASQASVASVMVNLGGDIAVAPGAASRKEPYHWQIGVEPIPGQHTPHKIYRIARGAIATSGNTRRFIVHQGQRYGHLLNPTTGWPVEDAPLTVTVLAPSAIQAGFLATYASLLGSDAERMLAETPHPHEVCR